MDRLSMFKSVRALIILTVWMMATVKCMVKERVIHPSSIQSPVIKPDDNRFERIINSTNSVVYPFTRSSNQTDNYHGVNVEDPYRWLEKDMRESAEVSEWVKAQNSITFNFIGRSAERKEWVDRIKELGDHEMYGCPEEHGGTIFFKKNRGLENYDVLYANFDGSERVVLDPNQDGTYIWHTAISRDGLLVAYDMSLNGGEWLKIRVRDVRTGVDLPDRITNVKSNRMSWSVDGRGFFYSGFENHPYSFHSTYKKHSLFYHEIGTHQTRDILVYSRPDIASCVVRGEIMKDGRHLIIRLRSQNRISILISEVSNISALNLIELLPLTEGIFTPVGSRGNLIYFSTDIDAPRGRLIAVDLNNPQKSKWREILPQQEKDVLHEVSVLDEMIVAIYLRDAHSVMKLYNHDGLFIREVNGGRDALKFCNQIGSELFYLRTAWEKPSEVQYFNPLADRNGQHKKWKPSKLAYDPSTFETKERFVISKDGTPIHIFITSHRSMILNGLNPTLLIGYGGFGYSLEPKFEEDRIAWCEKGGVWVTSNIRGGGEYGNEWHLAGSRDKKQNSFDDFIAVAEFLVSEKYTNKDRLAITSRCNGGLLIGAVLAQRPELFGAAIPEFGLFDMIRFHLFTTGPYWKDEYGTSDNKTEFNWLYSYSPYHNVLKHGSREYPPTLILTGDRDERVIPAHSFKFTAALQKYQTDKDAPILMRVETRAGHIGITRIKLFNKQADRLTFISKVFK